MVNQQKPQKPEVTKEEEQYRKKQFPDVKEVYNKNWCCTSCGGSVKALISKGKAISHPFLQTLFCEKCKSFYGDGHFSEDEDGCDKYCRWCGQGGTLFLCSKCTAGFCKKCVKRNLPRSALIDIESDDWICYCCNPKPLFELRAQCWAALQYAQEYVKDKKEKSRPSSSIDRPEPKESKKIKRKRGSSSEEEATAETSKRKHRSSKKPRDSEPESDKDSKKESKNKKEKEPNKKKKDGKEKDSDNRNKKKSPSEKEIGGLKASQWDEAFKFFTKLGQDVTTVTKRSHKTFTEYNARKVNINHIDSIEKLMLARDHVCNMLTKEIDVLVQLKDSFNRMFDEWHSEVVPNKVEAEISKKEEGKLENGQIEEEPKQNTPEESSNKSLLEESKSEEKSSKSSSDKTEEQMDVDETSQSNQNYDENTIKLVEDSPVKQTVENRSQEQPDDSRKTENGEGQNDKQKEISNDEAEKSSGDSTEKELAGTEECLLESGKENSTKEKELPTEESVVVIEEGN